MTSSGKGKKRKDRTKSLLRILPLWVRVFLSLLILLIVITAAGQSLLPRFGIDLKIPFTRHEKISESDILLTRIRPLLNLNTVEYTYKSVFPYDFIPEGVDILRAYQRFIQGKEVTTDEKKAAELYRLCADAGIRVWSRDYAFVVITTHVKGGYDLKRDKWPGGKPPGSAENSDSQGSTDAPGSTDSAIQTNPVLGTVSILLPPPRITDFVLRDETSSRYRYPDIEVDAEEWKMISEYVETHIRERVLAEGILERTDRNMRGVITKVLRENGWEKVTFRN